MVVNVVNVVDCGPGEKGKLHQRLFVADEGASMIDLFVFSRPSKRRNCMLSASVRATPITQQLERTRLFLFLVLRLL